MQKYALIIIGIFFAFTAYSNAELSIEGKVKHFDTKKPLEGIQINIDETHQSTTSDLDGNFKFSLEKAGNYTLNFITKNGLKTVRKVKIGESGSSNLTVELVTGQYNASEVVVYGASRRAEKITESPAAVTAVFSEELERKSRQGQLAYSIAGNAGVDVLRNGANDFIVNTRGFNGGLNRRLLVLQDGRDVAMPLLGAMEWNSFSLPQDDFESIELVRGPAAALYGANAFNGVLIMKSRSPKDIPGTRISLLGGDFETYKVDIRHAGTFSNLSYKVSLGRSSSLNLANRRDSAKFLEYSGLPLEKKVLTTDDRQTFSNYGSIRLDYDLSDMSSITGEFGYSRSGNEAYVFGLGRTFVKDAERPYLRLEYNSERINLHAHYMSRFTPDTMWLLVPNAPLLDNSKDVMIDFQHNFNISENLHFIWGITEQLQYIRTYGTSIPNDVDANYTGVYAQAEWKYNSKLKVVASSRFDYASIHPSYFSPRLSLVFSPLNEHQFRVSFNKAFQRPNYSDLYRLTPDAPAFSPITKAPVNFANLQNKIADSIAVLSGSRPELNLDLNAMRASAVGNDKLEVEKILGYEFGYKGTFSDNFYLTIDVFYNRLNDFITNFLPGVNPNIKSWSPVLPDSLSAFSNLVKDMVYSELSDRDKARLAMFNGKPTFVVSNANIGKVDEYGIEASLNFYPISSLHVKADYSYYCYKVVENSSSQPLLPNTSPHRASLSLNYLPAKPFDVGIEVQYSHKFEWLAGTYFGEVPSYTIVNLNAGLEIINNLSLGINVFNVLNKKHYQIFGGTYLPRMATARISYTI